MVPESLGWTASGIARTCAAAPLCCAQTHKELFTLVIRKQAPRPQSGRRERSRAADAALTAFDELPDAAHVRVPTVARLCGISTVTVWRWARDGRIPAPVKRGGVTAWRVGDLRQALYQR